MGEIISSRVCGNSIVYRILLPKEEVLAIKNAVNNTHLFALDLCNINSSMFERGRKNSTKYFTIPFCLRVRKRKSFYMASYQKLETSSKVFYIYVIHKNLL
jgi:hypothetical protein